jgi:3-hydroxyacyl-[acyl-carrier-protein] dehydratase
MDGDTIQEKIDQIDITRLMEMIPHRYPMLMIDKLIEVVPGESAIGVKNVTINEPYFQGHFPAKPVMPGVLLIEAMAQTAAALVVQTVGAQAQRKVVYFMAIDGARFRKPVMPGDRVLVHVVKKQQRGPVWKFQGEAKVDGVLVAEATIAAMYTDEEA